MLSNVQTLRANGYEEKGEWFQQDLKVMEEWY